MTQPQSLIAIALNQPGATALPAELTAAGWTQVEQKPMAALPEYFIEAPLTEADEIEAIRSQKATLLLQGVLNTELFPALHSHLENLRPNALGLVFEWAGQGVGARAWSEWTDVEDLLEGAVGHYLLEGDRMTTQGMAALGLPDLVVQDADAEYASELLSLTSFEALEDPTILIEGYKLAHPEKAAAYRLAPLDPKTLNPEEPNPFGAFRLVKILA